jgi:hypothetical protein
MSPNPLAPGAVATLTATVQVGGAPVTGGTVTFLDGQRVLGTAQVVASGAGAGTASLKTRSFQPGQHSLTAVYGGAPNGSQNAAGSTSAALVLAVQGLVAPAISLLERADRSTPGTYDLTATVTGTGLPAAPTGAVTFSIEDMGLGSVQLGTPETSQGFPATAVNYPDNNAISQVVSADFNNDGAPDLAGIAGGGGSVTELPGDPLNPGKFLAPITFQTASGTTAIVTADFNNDGWTDVAVLHGATVGILLGDPSNPGQFLPETTIPAIANPIRILSQAYSLVTADFNGDGVLDLAVADGTAEKVTILLGNVANPGTFLPAVQYAVPGVMNAIAVGDFNGDGLPDLAVASGQLGTFNSGAGFISVLLGDPSHPGAFPNATVVSYLPAVPNTLVAADFNRDGATDIAFTYPTIPATTNFLPGDPAHPGQFLSPVQVFTALSITPADYMTTADFNNDGLPDLTIIDGATVEILFNQPATPGTFRSGYTYTLTGGSVSLDAVLGADLNGDEIPDIVLAEPYQSAGVGVLLSNLTVSAEATISGISLPGGSQSIGASYSGDNNFSAPAAATLNASLAQPTTTTLATSPSGTAAKGTVVTLTATVTANGQGLSSGKVRFLDGKRVLGSSQITSSGTAVLKTWSFNPGTHALTAVFEATPHATQGNLGASVSSAVNLTVTGQLTSGGGLIESSQDKNLINYNLTAFVGGFGPNPPTGAVTVQDTTSGTTLANGTLSSANTGFGYLPAALYTASSGAYYSAANTVIADFNGDGVPDIAAVDVDSSSLDVLLGDPAHPGQFLPGPTIAITSTVASIATADFNGDGVPDLAVIVPNAISPLQILLGDPSQPGQFLPVVGYSFPNARYATALIVGDLNGDGFADLMATGLNVAILLNDPTHPGQFLNTTPPSFGNSTATPAFIADLNGDGAADIVWGNSYLPGDPANPGQFLAPVSLNLTLPNDVEAVGDFNGDGLPDLLVGYGISLAGSQIILLNDPGHPGQFISKTLPFSDSVIHARTADVNGDGTTDLILEVGNASIQGFISPRAGIQVLLGDPSNPGQFIPQPVLPDLYLSTAAISDLNGDGIPDLAFPDYTGVGVSLGATINSAYFPNTPVTTPGPNTLTVSYSGDSNYGASLSPGLTLYRPFTSTTVLSASPLATSAGSTVTLTAVITVQVSPAKGGTVQFFDGTTLLASTQIIWPVNGSSGTAQFETRLGVGSHSLTAVFSGAPLAVLSIASSASSPVMITINGPPTTATSLLVSNAGPGKYNLAATVSAFNKTAATGSVTFRDLSQRTELGSAPLSSNGVFGFGAPSLTSLPSNGASVAVGDLNGDGLPDLAVANGTSVTVLMADPVRPGQFQSPINVGIGYSVTDVAIADVNEDGIPDLVVAVAGTLGGGAQGYIDMFLGTSPGHFTNSNNSSGIQSFGLPIAIKIADFNRDGTPDVAAFSAGGVMSIFEDLPSAPGTLSGPNGFQANPGVNTFVSPAPTQVQLQVADFNNDGFPDLLSANGTLAITLANSDTPGDFLIPAQNLGSGSFPVVGDFNGDGLPDIAYWSGGNQITVLLSTAGQPGTFQLPVTYLVGNGVSGLAVGDFNGDGLPDLAIANGSDNTISILTNDANHRGQFLPQMVYTTAASPSYLVASDMNGDGFTDLVALDQAGNVEVLLSGVQTGAVLSNIELTGSGYHNLQATYHPGNNRFNALLGGSDSNVVRIITPSTPIVTLSANPASLVLGSVTTLVATVAANDGSADNVAGGSVQFFDGKRRLGSMQVVIAGSATGTATLRTASFGLGTHPITAVFSGMPRGLMPALGAISAPVSVTVTGMAASSTNLIVTPDPSNNANSAFQANVLGFGPALPSGTVSFVNNTASATLGSVPLTGPASLTYGSSVNSPVVNSYNGYDAITGDFNNDGIPDLAFFRSGGLSVTLGDPQHLGQFLPETDYPLNVSFAELTLATGDFNGDGILDLAVGPFLENDSPNQPPFGMLVFLGDPAHPGQFQTPQTIPLNNTPDFFPLVAADFNGDGLTDLAYFDGSVHILLTDPTHPAQFLPGIVTQLSGSYTSMAVADINQDGFPDLVLSSPSAGSTQSPTIAILLADPANPGHFIPGTGIAAGSGISSIAVTDFNGDGLPDILAVSSSLILYSNDPSHPGTFLPPVSGPPLALTSNPSLTVYDMNGDGYPDVVLSSGVMLLNNPSHPGQFLPAQSTGITTFQQAIADFNSDGLPDFAVFSPGTLTTYAGASTLTANLGNIALSGSGQSIVANYSGDDNYQPSVSNTVTAPSTTALSTTLTLGSLPATVNAGTTVIVTAAVTSSAGLPTSGSVQFSFGGGVLATVPLNAAGFASLPVALLTPGYTSIFATYTGTSTWSVSNNLATVLVKANPQPALVAASPNPILVTAGDTTGSTSLSWTAPAATTVEVHANSPDGPLVASGGSSNSGVAVTSVSDGTIFYLQDTSNGNPLTLGYTLDTVMVHVRSAPIFSATPNPMVLGSGATTGTTLLQWNAPAGVTAVEIHQGSFNGPLMGSGGATGSAPALAVAPGTVFYLQDTTGGKALSPSGTLGILTVH